MYLLGRGAATWSRIPKPTPPKSYLKSCRTSKSVSLLQLNKNTLDQESMKVLDLFSLQSRGLREAFAKWCSMKNQQSLLCLNQFKNKINFYQIPRWIKRPGCNLVLRKFLKINQTLGIILSKKPKANLISSPMLTLQRFHGHFP